MLLILNRIKRGDNSTIGMLNVDGKFNCYILEDKDRGLKQNMSVVEISRLKLFGKTAIPAGTYDVAITYSTKFKRFLPLLVNVPGFEGIRIHPGNTAADTEGCLLPGTAYTTDFVTNSKGAFADLFKQLEVAKNTKQFIQITVK